MKPSTSGGITGAASIPHRPVNTTRLITRGLVSANRSRQSAGKAAGSVIGREGTNAAIKTWAQAENPSPEARRTAMIEQ